MSPIRPSTPRPGTARARRLVTLFVGAAVGAVLVSTLASASPSAPNTTAVDFIPVSPAKVVVSGASIAKAATASYVVIAGATTVPSNATTVRLDVTVKGTAAGTIAIYPMGNTAPGFGGSASWAAGTTTNTTVNVNVGLNNKVSVTNNSTASAIVTLKITGYSTEVTADGLNGSGGTAGQVLTNNGTGAVQWKTPGAAFASQTFSAVALATSYRQVASVTVPAGAYVVTFSATLSASTSSEDYTACYLAGPGGNIVAYIYANASTANSQNVLSATGLVNAGAGNITVNCLDSYNAAYVYYPDLVASRVGDATGAVSSGASSAAAARQAPQSPRIAP